MKIPLSWLQLSREKMRLLIAIAGITFADLLMFIQLGFKDSLLESTTTLHRSLDGDIFLMSPQTDASIAFKTFSRRRLHQTLGMAGVEDIAPVYIQFGLWKNPLNNRTRSIGIVGFNPRRNILNIPEINQNLNQIKLADVVLFDNQSRAEFGPIPELLAQGDTVTTEVQSRKITVGGLFNMGASFAADGWLVTSDVNFWRIFSERDPGLIDIGIIWVQPDADVNTVIENLRTRLPSDVRVLSREEFIDTERDYWQSSTAIGFIFSFGVVIGFIVGIVIVYQILYTDITDHLPEYATLKAMGYTDKYFAVLVLQEAFILAILGFVPGLLISTLVYQVAAAGANLTITMTMNKATTVLILTIIMCMSSGLVAIRKLSAADPADIF
ncbi:MAG: FtsX-like permease family protein [Gloeocapsa sp. DLM2.Bin57]|nr:MAG: FtsX-like permease family protein [Gloeocapsa sp. DLM2.Bin57]